MMLAEKARQERKKYMEHPISYKLSRWHVHKQNATNVFPGTVLRDSNHVILQCSEIYATKDNVFEQVSISNIT